MELVEQRRSDKEPADGRSRRLDRAMRDLVPVTLVAGAAAVAVALAVGESTSGLTTPFARGAGSGGVASPAPADPAETDRAKVTVRLGPRANRTQPAAAVGQGPDLVLVPSERAGAAAAPASDFLIFAPIGIGVTSAGPEAAAPPAAPLVVPEAVLAPPVPAAVTEAEGVVAVVPPAVQEAQAVALPRPLKTPKRTRRQVDAGPLMAQTALGSITSPTKTPTVAAAEPAGEQGNSAVKGRGQRPDQPTGSEEAKDGDKDNNKG